LVFAKLVQFSVTSELKIISFFFAGIALPCADAYQSIRKNLPCASY
jgi:hypothetical protein